MVLSNSIPEVDIEKLNISKHCGVVVLDQNLLVVELNGAAEEILGISANVALKKSIYNLFSQNVNFFVLEYLIRQKRIKSTEVKLYKDGKEKNYLFEGNILKNSYGQCVGHIFLIYDVTISKEIACTSDNNELMEQQAKIQRLGIIEQQYSFLLDTLRYGIIAFNNDRIVTAFNKAAERLTGQKASDIIGKKIEEVTKNHSGEIKYFLKLTKREEEYRNQVFTLFNKGKKISIMADTHQLENEEGQRIGSMLVLNDISQIQELQEKTKNVDRQEKLQSFILDAMNYGVMGIDENSVINIYNKGAEKILGVPSSDVLGKTLDDAFPDILDENVIIKDTLINGSEYTNYPLNDNYRGKHIEVMANTLVIKDKQGKNTGAVIVFGDVSEVRKQEQLLAQHESIASVSRLAAGLAHEIRNPLTSIKGFVQLLQNKLKDGVETEYLDIILEELDRTNKLLSDFMLLAKPRKGQLRKMKVSPVLVKTIDFMKAQALLHDVEIRTNIDMDVPAIEGDEEQLKQVFINIIRNGIEAIPEKGVVWIKTESDNDQIRISFTDNGIGISEEVIDKIFHILYTTKQTGTGLGLSVCCQIIKHHGGKIEVQSKEGQGTTFTLILPVIKDN